jgi:transposase
MPSSPKQAALSAARRQRAWELRQQGWKVSQIAKMLGVTPGAVSRWLQHSSGQTTLLRDKKDCKLSADQLEQLLFLLPKGPVTYGLPGVTWARKTIAALIQQQFGVEIQEVQVTPVLQKIGWQLHPRVNHLRIWELKRQGKLPEEIAQCLNIPLILVQQCFATSELMARAPLRQRSIMAINSKLSLEQLQTLARLLLQPPARYGIAAKSWTRQAIIELIQQTYGVSFSTNHIPHLLRRIKHSIQIELVI